jgi:outer membrane protein insertion porin family
MHNYNIFGVKGLENGSSQNVSFTSTLTRSSQDQPIFPRSGSNFTLSLQVTPPYSAFRSNNDNLTDAQRYNYIEYYKWKFKANTYNKLVGFGGVYDLILNLGAQVGYLGMYNKKVGPSPFEGFQVGGSGMTGYQMYGQEVVALRGYEDQAFNTALGNERKLNMYVKYTAELRFPLTLQQSASIYALGFLEAGNAWYDHKKFNPLNVYRSAGVGIRAFLPMFGLLGIDWGYGFDPLKSGNQHLGKGQFHFVIGQQF